MSDWKTVSAIVPPHTEDFGSGRPVPPPIYLDRLRVHLAAAEQMGATSAFAYDFPTAVDPWLAAFDVLTHSALQPIVAVRPHQEGAESVARRVADIGYRFGTAAHVNIVAGATAASRPAGEDKAAARKRLGQFAADLRAEIDRRLDSAAVAAPLLLTPSSSTPGMVPVDVVLMMARPRRALHEEIVRVRAEQGVTRTALLVGMVVRDTEQDAWSAAAELHPDDRRRRMANKMFQQQAVSSEHRANYELGTQQTVQDERLWYGFPTCGVDAPKLIGSTEQVRAWLDECADLGVTDLIIDLPADAAEYAHMRPVLAPR